MPPIASPPYSSAPYRPPQHLLLHWTAAELAVHFQAFSDSLRYVENSPELVFERLVASLNAGFSNTARQERATPDGWREEMNALQVSVDELRVELAEVNAKVMKDNVQEKRGEEVKPTSRLPNDGKMQLIPHVKNALEDEWTRLVFKFTISKLAVNVEGTASTSGPSPAPGGCTWAEIHPGDPDFRHGHETLQGGPDKKITFKHPFIAALQVVVWLTDIEFKVPLLVNVSVSNVTITGFTLKIQAGEETVLRSVGVAWASFPSTKAGVSFGSLSKTLGGLRSSRNRKFNRFIRPPIVRHEDL